MKVVVCRLEDFPEGDRKIVKAGPRSIGVFNVEGEFFAIRNRCPHQGGPLCEGRVWGALEADRPGELRYSRGGEILACIWHGWEFDIRTGQSWCDPQKLRVRRYDVDVEPGERVKGPYVAETYPVTTEDEYVVVEVPA